MFSDLRVLALIGANFVFMSALLAGRHDTVRRRGDDSCAVANATGILPYNSLREQKGVSVGNNTITFSYSVVVDLGSLRVLQLKSDTVFCPLFQVR